MRHFAAAMLALALASPAAAAPEVRPDFRPDIRMIGGTDVLLVTDPSHVEGPLTDAEVGIGLRADARHLAHDRLDLKLDFRGRENILEHNASTNELYELSATVRLLPNRLELKLGRFPTPGGFWLIADGGMLRVRYTSWLEQLVYGGLRSFTTGRRNTWMTDNPQALPLAGTALVATHRLVSASLTFTWARDGIDLHQSWIDGVDRNVLERHIEDEYFLDAQVSIFPTEKWFFGAGASLGTRYDVQFAAANPYGPTTLGVATLGAFGAWAVAEWRATKTLRLSYSFNFERVRLFQSQLLALKPDGTPVQAVDGSFEDHVARLTWRFWRALRTDLSYRLRFRANTDVEHHVELGVRGDELWHGLGAFASVAVDADTLAGKQHDRVLYSAGLSYLKPWLDARAGILYTDGIGSGLTFSQHVSTSTGSQLFPFVLETQRIAFVRVFATFWKMFAGLDAEENLDAAQLRLLVQLGAAL